MEISVSRSKSRNYRKYRWQRNAKDEITPSWKAKKPTIDWENNKFINFFNSLIGKSKEEVYKKIEKITIKGKQIPYYYVDFFISTFILNYEQYTDILFYNKNRVLNVKLSEYQKCLNSSTGYKYRFFENKFYFKNNKLCKMPDIPKYKTKKCLNNDYNRHFTYLSNKTIKYIIQKEIFNWKTNQKITKYFNIECLIKPTDLFVKKGNFIQLEVATSKYFKPQTFYSKDYGFEEILQSGLYYKNYDYNVFCLKTIKVEELNYEEYYKESLTCKLSKHVNKFFDKNIEKKVNFWVTPSKNKENANNNIS